MKIVLDINDVFAKKYSEYDLKMYAAVAFYKERLMGLSACAEIVGMSRLEFMEKMSKYGCGALDMTDEELEMEINNAKKFL